MDKQAKIKEAHALLDRIEYILDSWFTQLEGWDGKRNPLA